MRTYPISLLLAALLIGSSGAVSTTSKPATPAILVAPTEYEIIDNYARRTPDSYARSAKTLSTYLTAPARTDMAKVRSIYAWIMSHIRYDHAGYTTAFLEEYEPASVAQTLRTRRAVCTDFAVLFKHLLVSAGVQAVTIRGYSRRGDVQAGLPVREVDHEWNAVKIDGDWYLFDLTWASTSGQPGRPNEFYFLTDPQAFIAQHFPADARWQLLDRPVSKADFDRFPNYRDNYFNLGFNPYFPKQGLLRTADEVILNLSNDDDMEFWCAVGPRGSSRYNQVPLTVRQDGNRYQLEVSVGNRRAQTLYVFARPKAGRGAGYVAYSPIMSFSVM
jgi:transglutaminase/protease-like cytokinesis protein 3